MAGLEDISDESLMARVQGGDHQAFAILVKRHTDRFFACAYRYVPQTQEAEDIVQNAFLKLWSKPQMWNPAMGAKFTTWFYRVVTNEALDCLRKRKTHYGRDDILEMLPSAEASAEQNMQEQQQAAYLEAAIQNLPERQKTALNLCFYEGLSNQDAADIMGIKPKALESLLMRAKAGIRDDLKRLGVLEDPVNRRHSYG